MCLPDRDDDVGRLMSSACSVDDSFGEVEEELEEEELEDDDEGDGETDGEADGDG